MRNASRPKAFSPATPENHYAKLVQARVSERAKAAIAAAASMKGLSEAAYLRGVIYQALGLAEKET